MTAQLKALSLRTLRFPGGEAADNYDWEGGGVERVDRFPFGTRDVGGKSGQLDYQEFLNKAKEVNAEKLFFVANLDGAGFDPVSMETGVAKYADKAARWVRSVKAKGVMVKYWEIGNEPYLLSGFPWRASEYASALKVFSQKMKAADPNILIGAVGPHRSAGSGSVGYADMLGKAATQALRNNIVSGKPVACAGDTRAPARCARSLGFTPLENNQNAWWDTVIDRAKDYFDFVVIHRYQSEHLDRGKVIFSGASIKLAADISTLKQYIEARKGTPIQLALTEWNVPNEAGPLMSDIEHAVDITEQLANYLQGGVDYALYWPWRMGGNKFSIVTQTGVPRSSFQLFEILQRYRGDRILKVSEPKNVGIYTFAMDDRGDLVLWVVNSFRRAQNVEVVTQSSPFKQAEWETLTGGLSSGSLTRVKDSRHLGFPQQKKFHLPPMSVSGIRLSIRGH